MTPSAKCIIKVPIQKLSLLGDRRFCHFLLFIRQPLLGKLLRKGWRCGGELFIHLSDGERGMSEELEVPFY